MSSLSEEVVPRFRSCQGSWRPDFLLEIVNSTEQHRICEINGRFAFNGFLHTAYGQQAHMDMDNKSNPLTTPVVRPSKASTTCLGPVFKSSFSTDFRRPFIPIQPFSAAASTQGRRSRFGYTPLHITCLFGYWKKAILDHAE